jgi:putative exosortase-associated protein (TIGR04073 family)
MLFGAALVFCQVTAPALAAEPSGPKSQAPRTDEESAGGKMFRKAVRGGQNLAFGLVTDVPRTVYYESRDHGAFYGFPVGLVKGVGLGAVRTAVGAWELLTVPIPLNDYEPVVLPAYPFEPGPTEAFPDTP